MKSPVFLKLLSRLASVTESLIDRAKLFWTWRRMLFMGGALVLLIMLFFAICFFWPRSVAFSVGGQNCLVQPLLFPGLVSRQQSESYRAVPQASLSIGSLSIYAHRTCIEPTKAPKEHARESISFGNALARKRITVTTKTFPHLVDAAGLAQPIPTREPLAIQLSESDRVFTYALAANDRTAGCTAKGAMLECDIAKLELAQSASYRVSLQRIFNGQLAGTVTETEIITVEAVRITASSIASGQTVFDAPSELRLTLNRPAVTLEGAKLERLEGDTRHTVPATFELQDATLTIRFNEPLPRSVSLELTVPELRAADGGFLAEAFVLPFATSGGPKVASVNIGSSKVDPASNIVLTFDSNVKAAQTLANFIKVEVHGKAVQVKITIKGNKVTIDPASDLPLCAQFTVRVLDGLQNEAGITGGSAWQRTSRVVCKITFSIGTSVKGRAITAYRFGSGDSKVIFVGGTHGDEKSSVYALNNLADYLEANPDIIPAHRTVVIIPSLNPDGFAASTRTNANNVDLNRNFPANDWKQGVTMPGGSFNPNGGGSAPLSEPESRALASYVQAQKPRLVLTYHAAAGVVIPNDSGDSVALAHTYDQKSNLGYADNEETGNIFQYDTTGAFENWLHDKQGIATLLIELWTKTGSEFSKNKDAMLHMIKLP